jgi:rare lipoprotein A
MRLPILLLLCLFTSCEALKNISLPTNPDATSASSGKASYYADNFQGKKTASGQLYDKNKLTAAHKTWSFNTKVEVTNKKNNKKVIVVINDRLPASSTRSIDLSYEAAKQLDMLRDGVVDVSLKILR